MSNSDNFQVKVEAEVYPTEDLEKVRRALLNLFPDLNFKVKQSDGFKKVLAGNSPEKNALINLKQLIMRERIRDATRSTIFSNMLDDSAIFYLNKQVAYADHISFCMPNGESPLGPIKVTLKSKQLQQLIDWLAPSSKSIRAHRLS
ncbi:MAG: hypothetical protein O2U61_00330 [Candidatus Bathyarchaeota archaeon]|nr:hypothetical protein [Candidatus Bathyarchaeota archaeon]MCZ2844940.1 hypothetical protein [Candidatus Bathyarchaeota archaeon]